MFLKHSLRVLVVVSMVIVMTSVSPAFADDFGTGGNAFTLDFVPISASSNPTPAQTMAGDLVGFGIVEHDYSIGVHEITNDQWNKFKAGLGVPVTGNDSASYDTGFENPGTGTVDVPTNKVSWLETLQFANWLNTSTGHQPAYKFTGTQGEEDYTFAPWAAEDAFGGTNLYRHKDAKYVLPSKDEWFKAAYWNGTEIQDFATKAGDTVQQGDGNGTGWNYGNNLWFDTGTPLGNIEGPWPSGSGSEELNGTYDMMGNIAEWGESPSPDPTVYGTGGRRPRNGGRWNNGLAAMGASSFSDTGVSAEVSWKGFRVSSVTATVPGISGDYNNSGQVGAGDLNLVLFNWNVDQSGLTTDWINERPAGAVGVTELNGVLFNWGNTATVAVVPEPSAGILFVLGVMAVGVRRFRR